MSKFIVAESFGHHIPTGLGWIEGLMQLGHTAYGLPTGRFNINDIDELVDYLIILGWPDVDDIIRFKQKSPDVKIIVVCFGWSEVVEKLIDYVYVWAEHTIMHDFADNIFKEHGLTLHHIPLGASTTRFYPLNTELIYDLSFVGQFGQNGHGYRHEDVYLHPLMRNELKGYYSGFSNYPFTAHSDLNTIYNTTKINVNFHYWDQKCQTNDPQTRIDFNGRVFEIALSGGFQLCDHLYARDYFGDGIITASPDEWRETFDYYLNNPIARSEASLKAQQTALQNHTWMCRMKQLIDIL